MVIEYFAIIKLVKLLLTSSGLTNKSIRNALLDLLDKPFNEAKLVFIPTASTAEGGHHDWFIDDLNAAYNLSWKEFDILELNGLPKDMILKRLDHADAIYVEGGNVYHLARSITNNWLADDFLKILRTKVYVGVSAGSMIFSRNLTEKVAQAFGELDELKELHIDSITPPLNLFDWYIKPHYNARYLPERNKSWAEKIATKVSFPIYFIDDQTALKVVDDEVEVISEGSWRLLNSA